MSDTSEPKHIGPYELEEPLGRGGMAEVYRARRDGPGGFVKDLALKRILPHYAGDERLVKRFMDEARIAGALNHGNVVQVNDFGHVDGDYFIVMEFIDGMPLATLMDRCVSLHVQLPSALVAFVGAEVGAGLGYAHSLTDAEGRSMDVVHRDVSPQNVMLSYSGDAKLADFGIAKAADKLARTEAGLLVGKVSYMSPEQARGDVIDGRADLFALGVVLWEALTLEPLIPRGDPAAALEALGKCEFRRPSELRPDVHPELDAIIMHALRKDPAGRYRDGETMARGLRAFVHRHCTSYGRHDLAEYLQWTRPDGEGRTTRTEPPKLAPPPDSEAELPHEVAPKPQEGSPASPSPWRWIGVVVGLLVGLLGGAAISTAVLLFVWHATPETSPGSDGVPPPAVVAPPPTPVTHLSVLSDPPGARVYVDGLLVGESPVAEQRPNDAPVTVIFLRPETIPQILEGVRPSAWSVAPPVARLLPTDQDHGVVIVRAAAPGAVLMRAGHRLGELPQAVVLRWEVDDSINPQGLSVMAPEGRSVPVDLSTARPWEVVFVNIDLSST